MKKCIFLLLALLSCSLCGYAQKPVKEPTGEDAVHDYYGEYVEYYHPKQVADDTKKKGTNGPFREYAILIKSDYSQMAGIGFADRLERAAKKGKIEAQYYLGVYKMRKRVLDEGIKWYQAASEHGHSDAQFLLGNCYYNGYGVSQNQTTAVRWYRMAAEQNHLGAQYILGKCLLYGTGVSQNVQEAARWLSSSTEQGFGGEYLLKKCYEYDESIIKKPGKETLEWYAKLAEQGDVSIQYALGKAYYYGKSVSANYEEAVKWLNPVVEKGLAEAQYLLGMCYYDGKGVPQDYEQATKLFELAAKQGYANAQYSLGVCYYDGEGVSKNFVQAVKWLNLAAKNGYNDAKKNLKSCYEAFFKEGEGVSKNIKNAISQILPLAEEGDALAQYYLGKCYYEGDGKTAPNYKEAVKWFLKSAEQGNVDAQYNIANCYYNGHGVMPNIEQLVKWLTRAAEQGHIQARKDLSDWYFETGDGRNAYKWLMIRHNNGEPDATYLLGACYYHGFGTYKNINTAIELWTQAANAGYALAMSQLGIWWYIVGINNQIAFYWFHRAAETGDSGAQYYVGLCYATGSCYVDENLQEAKNWCRKAAEQGHKDAKIMLQELEKGNQKLAYEKMWQFTKEFEKRLGIK